MTWPIILAICAVLGGALGVLGWYACTVPRSQVFGPAVVRGPVEGRRVVLTFDDGPAAPFTEQILDILREQRVPATFFVCGRNVERFPEIVRRIHAEGHTLGNHTYSHPFLWLCDRARIAEEIDRTQELIEEVTGDRPKILRPPYGIRWFGLHSVVRERGMHVIQWSDTGYDWKNRADAIVRATLRGLRPGAVIALHDGHEVRSPSEIDRSNTVEALPAIIDGARAVGFQFVRLKEFLPIS